MFFASCQARSSVFGFFMESSEYPLTMKDQGSTLQTLWYCAVFRYKWILIGDPACIELTHPIPNRPLC